MKDDLGSRAGASAESQRVSGRSLSQWGAFLSERDASGTLFARWSLTGGGPQPRRRRTMAKQEEDHSDAGGPQRRRRRRTTATRRRS